MHDQLANGGPLKMLCVLDENTRECLAIEVGKSLRSQDVILTLSRLMRIYGKPAFMEEWSEVYPVSQHPNLKNWYRPEVQNHLFKPQE